MVDDDPGDRFRHTRVRATTPAGSRRTHDRALVLRHNRQRDRTRSDDLTNPPVRRHPCPGWSPASIRPTRAAAAHRRSTNHGPAALEGRIESAAAPDGAALRRDHAQRRTGKFSASDSSAASSMARPVAAPLKRCRAERTRPIAAAGSPAVVKDSSTTDRCPASRRSAQCALQLEPIPPASALACSASHARPRARRR